MEISELAPALKYLRENVLLTIICVIVILGVIRFFASNFTSILLLAFIGGTLFYSNQLETITATLLSSGTNAVKIFTYLVDHCNILSQSEH